MIKHLIFHLPVLAEKGKITAIFRQGLAQLLEEKYGTADWDAAYLKILADWDSYHEDLNFAGDEGMADMREARFRIMRAMFRLTKMPEPSQELIHELADEALEKAPLAGDVFYPETAQVLNGLCLNYHITVISYFPQAQVEAMLYAAGISDSIRTTIGADSFERYKMDESYFQTLMLRLNAKAEECLLIDRQEDVLHSAEKMRLRVFRVANQSLENWHETVEDYLKN